MIICKRGVTNNLLGIIIAVIGIIGLIFLGVKIYNGLVDLEDKKAQAFIDGLIGKIENLGNGEENTFALSGLNNWFLVAYNRDEKTTKGQEVSRPEKCFLNDFCLCMCESSSRVEDCQERGFCRKIDRSVNVKSSFTYYDSESFNTDGVFMSCIPLYKTDLRAFFVSKQSSIFINSTLGDLNSLEDKEFYSSLNFLSSETYPCTRTIIPDKTPSNYYPGGAPV